MEPTDNHTIPRKELCPYLRFVNNIPFYSMFSKMDNEKKVTIILSTFSFIGATSTLVMFNARDVPDQFLFWILGGTVGFLFGFVQHYHPWAIPTVGASFGIGLLGKKLFRK